MLGAQPCVVGRLKSCGLTLDGEAESSRRHFEVLRDGSRWVLNDLGSRNGTRLNGQRVDGRAPLWHDDRIQVGQTVIQFQSAPAPLPAGTRLGNCELGAPTGRSRCGTLYAGRQGSLERDVIVEVVDPDLAGDPEFRQGYEARAQLAGSFDHPSIQAVFDTSRGGDQLYAVYEVSGGEPLGDLIERRAFGREESLEVLEALANVLAHVHGRGKQHGALSPWVVLKTADGIKLTGLGQAARIHAHMPDAERRVTCASPEEARGQPAGPASDVYSLGVLAFRLLVGRWPYEGRAKEVLGKHGEPDPVPLPGSLDPSLGQLLGRLLAKAPADRAGAEEAVELFAALRGGGAPKRKAAGSARRKGSARAGKDSGRQAGTKDSGVKRGSSSARRKALASSGRKAAMARRTSSANLTPVAPDPGPVLALRLVLLVFGYLMITVAVSAITRIVLRGLGV